VNRPRVVDGARLQYDDVRDEHLLLIPEGAVSLTGDGGSGARAVRR
jgi:pyrroloquinoline quinone biosynthesis protein D